MEVIKMNRKFSQIIAVCLACVCVLSLNTNVVDARDKLRDADALSAVAEVFSNAYVEQELYKQKTQMRAVTMICSLLGRQVK